MKLCGHILFFALVLSSAYVRSAEIIVSPSKLYPQALEASKVYYEISCFDNNTNVLLDCPFSVEITGLVSPSTAVDNSGGHSHADPTLPLRPLGELQFGKAKGKRVVGSTGKQNVEVVQQVSEVSGRIAVTFNVGSPPNYICIGSFEWTCIDRTTGQSKDTVAVQVSGLFPLYGLSGGVKIIKADGSEAPYVKKRSADIKHTDDNAFYGLPDTLSTLERIAAVYKKATRKPLSINDMSLPKGGKFDVDGSWSGPHGEHRLGISADINKEGVNCEDDGALQKAVDFVIKPTTPRYVNMKAKGRTTSRLLCESQGRKHIDFDLPLLPTP